MSREVDDSIDEFAAWAARESLRVLITRFPYGKDAWTVKLTSSMECTTVQTSGSSLQECINCAIAAYNILMASSNEETQNE